MLYLRDAGYFTCASWGRKFVPLTVTLASKKDHSLFPSFVLEGNTWERITYIARHFSRIIAFSKNTVQFQPTPFRWKVDPPPVEGKGGSLIRRVVFWGPAHH